MTHDPTPTSGFPVGGEEGLSPRSADRLTLAFLLLGALACTVRFGLRFPLWPDDAHFAINLVHRDFAGILQPLEYHQVAPPLFLLADRWPLAGVLSPPPVASQPRASDRCLHCAWPPQYACDTPRDEQLLGRYSHRA